MPLQIGVAALASLARAAALLLPAGVLSAAATWFVVGVLPDMGDLSGYLFALIGGPPLTLLAFAWRHLKRARDQRPSDLLLDAEGFTVHGGPHDGVRVAWSVVSTCTVVPPKPKDEDDASAGLHRVCLELQGQPPLWLAGTDHAVERESLSEVAATLRSREAKVKARDLPPEVVTCTGCHAPLPPSPDAQVTCAFCGASNVMPQALRDRLAAQKKIDGRDAKAVTRLLDQPGAGFLGKVFAAGALFMLTAWPIAALLLWLNVERDLFTWGGAGALVLFVAACIAGFFTFLRGRLVDRQALRLLTVRFCARASGPQGKTLACRSCFAPLPRGAPRALVACAYCGAPNVLAVDFTAQAHAVDDEQQSLSRALARRASERSQWRLATAAGLVLIAGSAYALRAGIGRDPNAAGCRQGDVAACVKLARRDSPAAQTQLKKACDGGGAAACVALGDLWGDILYSQAQPLLQVRQRACELGSADGCEALGELLKKGNFGQHVEVDLPAAAAAYQRGCSLDGGVACTDWGYSLTQGRGVPADVHAAGEVYARACHLGNAMGCNDLGTMFERGEGGLPVDATRAAELYGEACDAGAQLGCSNAAALAR